MDKNRKNCRDAGLINKGKLLDNEEGCINQIVTIINEKTIILA